jgi:hypothetical protein
MALPAEHATTTTMPSILVIIVSLPGQVDEIEDCRKHALCVTGNLALDRCPPGDRLFELRLTTGTGIGNAKLFAVTQMPRRPRASTRRVLEGSDIVFD